MRSLLPVLASFTVAAAPAAAQTPPAEPAPVAEPKTVKKVVCKRIEVERVVGSRLSATTRQCREIKIEAKNVKGKDSNGASHSAHAQ